MTTVVSDRGSSVYSVPPRFGLTAIFSLTTLMAVLFGSLRQVEAHPAVYFCLSVTTLVVCIVQMLYGRWPRAVSAVAGAAAMPLCFALSMTLWPPRFLHMVGREQVLFWGTLVFLPAGAFIGYLSGTCLAGIFLIQDAVESYASRRQKIIAS